MTRPVEARIRQPSDADVYAAVKAAFPEKSDIEIIAELSRTIVSVAVYWNEIVEGGESADDVLARSVFFDCDDLAGYFPWPE